MINDCSWIISLFNNFYKTLGPVLGHWSHFHLRQPCLFCKSWGGYVEVLAAPRAAQIRSQTKQIATYHLLSRFPVLRHFEICGKWLNHNRALFTSYHLTLVLAEYLLMLPLKPRKSTSCVLWFVLSMSAHAYTLDKRCVREKMANPRNYWQIDHETRKMVEQ